MIYPILFILCYIYS